MAELEKQAASPSFWDDQNKAKQVIDRTNALRAVLNPYQELTSGIEDVELMIELAEEEADAAQRAAALEDLASELARLEKSYRGLEFQSLLGGELDTHGVDAAELSLATLARLSMEVPPDCEALILAGPLQAYSQDEAEVVRSYLNRGGRLLLLLSQGKTGLEYILEDWGVTIREGDVRQIQLLPGTRMATNWVAVRSFDRRHAITSVFEKLSRFEMTLYLPRALVAGGREKGRDATVLLETGPGGDDKASFLVVKEEGRQQQTPGSFPVAVAVEQFVPERPPPGFQHVDTRLVVVGARGFIEDEFFRRPLHRDFFMNSLAWLLGEEEQATVSGEEWTESMLPMGDATARKFLLWVPLGLLPATFLAFAALVFFARRT